MFSLTRSAKRLFLRWTTPGSNVLTGINFVIAIYAMVMVIVAVGLTIALLLPMRVDGQDTERSTREYRTANDYRIEELEKRVQSIESLKIDVRLAVIESLVKETNSNSVWGPMSMGGIGLLALREAMRTYRNRNSQNDDDV